MSRIKIMSKTLANRIAAGEVIERPASVVKELVENSIDAGASEITVEIERAGNRLIAVTDNGCGMDDEDAVLALQQHGTSKLLSEDDLEHIMTLGFRGEALPSIASVSRFILTTRQADAPGGICVECDENGNISTRPHGGAPGTRIEVRDLFCNLPARKKFLKSAATEEHHIEETFSQIAIAHPEITFKLLLDNRISLMTPGSGKIEYRLREIFGKSFVSNMLYLEHIEGNLHISGYIGAPGFTRPSRRDQRIFINSRPVEAQAIYRGIKDGYATLAEPGRYNPVILFIEMPPGDLDVNVHPAKREVRFKAEYAVSRAVAAAISTALRQTRDTGILSGQQDEFMTLSGKLPLSMILDAAEISYTPPTAEQPELPVVSPPVSQAVVILPEKNPQTAENYDLGSKSELVSPHFAEPVPQNHTAQKQNVSPLVKPVSPAAFSGIWPHRVIGVIDRTYILCESANGLVLIDQHAAHERIMFEKILAEYSSGKASCQQLLLPETVELSRPMVKLLSGNREIFESLGFDIESAGGNTVIISAIPLVPCAHREISGWINEMLDELLDNGSPDSALSPAFAAGAACKAAVKAHEELSMDAMNKLLEDLKNCRQGTLCPHGRPTMVELSVRELERRFGRK